MADRKLTERLPPPNDLPQPRWKEVRPGEWRVNYDKETDTLFIVPQVPEAAVSIDVDGVWFRMNPSTGEIVGIEIEDFEHVFLARQPELANAWKMFHARRMPDAQRQTWIETLIKFLRDMFGGNGQHPQQPKLHAAT